LGTLRKHGGGAETQITVLFADIRGSTGLAERIGTARFTALLQRFYQLAAEIIDRHDGVVDKFLGDGVMALFIPVITGPDHAARAMAGARELLAAGTGDLAGAFGIGIHSGPAFVGAIGTAERRDFTALGDTVNVAAKLGGAAAGGEALASLATWREAGQEPAPGLVRLIAIPGRDAPLEAAEVPTRRPAAPPTLP
jgi:adenylate cyclase